MTYVHSCFMPSPTKCHPLQKSQFGILLPSSSSCLRWPPSKSSIRTAYYLKNVDFKFQSKTNVIQAPNATGSFHPSIWDNDHIISLFTSTDWEKHDTLAEKKIQELKMEVDTMFSLVADDSFKELELIDNLQKLGIAYHFQPQIEDTLKRIYNDGTHIFDKSGNDNLYFNSIWFRLMRQAGYRVPTDVFNKFKDERGEFHSKLTSDIESMLSLYEASYMRINGEDIMDEALAFTTEHLNSMLLTLDSSSLLALEIEHALKHPIQQTVERVQTRHYLSVYQNNVSQNEVLLKFAKLDFNVVQIIHQRELSDFLKWYEDRNMRSKVPFDTRDRGVECYLIANALLFEPQYSLERIQFAKLWANLSIIDDVHDVYGNVEELKPLRDAIQMWDDADFDSMTNVIKIVFLDTFNLVNEVEQDMIQKGHFTGLTYFRKEVQSFARGQFDEVEILFTKELPTVEECISIFYRSASTVSFFIIAIMHMGELATREVFDWVVSNPKIIHCSTLINRIADDITAPKEEHRRGITISCVTCYMKEHGVSESKATESLNKMMMSLWKDMNEECLRPNPVPMPILKLILNTSRMMATFYSDGINGYSISEGRIQGLVRSLLIDPVPL